MRKIKVEFEVDLDNLDETKKLISILSELSGVDVSPSNEEAPEEEPDKPDKPAKKAPVKKAKKQDPDPEIEDDLDGDLDEEITISDIRSVLALKVDDHRDAIKKKLLSFKAKNVSTLQKEHFSSFMEFLQGL